MTTQKDIEMSQHRVYQAVKAMLAEVSDDELDVLRSYGATAAVMSAVTAEQAERALANVDVWNPFAAEEGPGGEPT